MNGSMNFGNIGFGNVSSGNSNEQNSVESLVDNSAVNNNAPANVNTAVETLEETSNQSAPSSKPDLMAGVKEAQEEKDAINDFKNTNVRKTNFERDADNFSQIDFGPLKRYLDDDDITDISYSNSGQLWLKSLEKGVYRADQQDVDDALIEKIAFQCSNIMGKTFNMAHPFLDSESAELRMNFVHESIARNGIAVVFRKTPAKIRLEKQKLLNEKYIRLSIHDFLINCVKGHCNIIVCGETGSGKTELVKYLASHTAENEKLITIEDTLELHLDRIFPHRDIVAMKTNNIASYTDVLVTCMRQNPIWILLSEVRSAEAVTAVRNSISSGHYILSTIHADKAESIPHRMYSLLESNIDVEQFLKTIYRYVQIGVFVRGRYSATEKRFVREIAGVCEFFVTDDTNEPKFNNIYLKTVGGEETYTEPTKYIKNYLEGQGIDINNLFGEKLASLADANKANGVESDVKEASGEIVHIPGNSATSNVANSSQGPNQTQNVAPDNTQQQASAAPVNVQPQPTVAPVNVQPQPTVAPVNVQPQPTVAPVNVQPQPTVAPVNVQPQPMVAPVNVQPQQTVANNNINVGNNNIRKDITMNNQMPQQMGMTAVAPVVQNNTPTVIPQSNIKQVQPINFQAPQQPNNTSKFFGVMAQDNSQNNPLIN